MIVKAVDEILSVGSFFQSSLEIREYIGGRHISKRGQLEILCNKIDRILIPFRNNGIDPESTFGRIVLFEIILDQLRGLRCSVSVFRS